MREKEMNKGPVRNRGIHNQTSYTVKRDTDKKGNNS